MKELRLSGIVGWEISSQQVQDFLTSAGGDDITVYLNTRGGDVYEGVDIYEQFASYKGKKTVVLGALVASIGSYIITAFDTVIAQDVTMFMIHNATMGTYGDHKVLRNDADSLEKMTQHIADRLSRFSGKKVEDVLALMDGETWYYGKEIIDNGFATDYQETGKAVGDKENILSIAKHTYHDQLKKFAALYEGEAHKPVKEEQKDMDLKEVLNALNPFIADKSFTVAQAIALFGADNQLITPAQKAILDAVGNEDIVALKEKAKKADEAERAKAMTDAFGADGDLREYANRMAGFGVSIEDIKKDPLAVKLAATKASGKDEDIIVDEVPKDTIKKSRAPKRVTV